MSDAPANRTSWREEDAPVEDTQAWQYFYYVLPKGDFETEKAAREVVNKLLAGGWQRASTDRISVRAHDDGSLYLYDVYGPDYPADDTLDTDVLENETLTPWFGLIPDPGDKESHEDKLRRLDKFKTARRLVKIALFLAVVALLVLAPYAWWIKILIGLSALLGYATLDGPVARIFGLDIVEDVIRLDMLPTELSAQALIEYDDDHVGCLVRVDATSYGGLGELTEIVKSRKVLAPAFPEKVLGDLENIV